MCVIWPGVLKLLPITVCILAKEKEAMTVLSFPSVDFKSDFDPLMPSRHQEYLSFSSVQSHGIEGSVFKKVIDC